MYIPVLSLVISAIKSVRFRVPASRIAFAAILTGTLLTIAGVSSPRLAVIYDMPDLFAWDNPQPLTPTLSPNRTSSFNIPLLAPEPTVQASNMTFTNVGQNSMTVNWTSGNGSTRILLAFDQPLVGTDPVDGTTYSIGNIIGNGRVLYIGSGSSFDTSSIPGLILEGNKTTYWALYEFNGSGGTENYLTVNPAMGSQATLVATYTWNGTTSTDYTVSTNWTPNRNKGVGDILQFNDGGTDNVTNVQTETIGKLAVSGNTAVTLSPAPSISGAGTISRNGNTVTGVGTSFTTDLNVGDVIYGNAGILYSDVTAISSDTALTTSQSGTSGSQPYFYNRTLSISGVTGDDLTVGAGCQLNIGGSNPNNLRISLRSGTTANVFGSMTFSGNGNVAHRLTASDPSAITFQPGSVFTTGTSFIGSVFGNTPINAGTAIFASGSTYDFQGGGSPFGANAPNAAVVFQTGSLYKHESSNSGPQLGGRTYANFELNNGAANFAPPGSNTPLIVDNLTITAGSLTIGSFGTGHAIRGNITVNAGATLNFSPTTAGTFDLNGPSVQTISGGGNLSFNNNQTIAINNPGVTLQRNVFLNGPLVLTNGIVSTGANNLQINPTGSVSRTNGYVSGTLVKGYSAPGAKTFEVGTANAYSPVDVNVTTASPAGAPFFVKAVQGAQPNIPNPAKALSRYWTLSGATLTADLTFHYATDAIDVPGTANESNFQIERYTAGAFAQPGGSVDTAANTATILGVSQFSDWTLAEPGAFPTPTPTPTPSPTPTPPPGLTFGDVAPRPNGDGVLLSQDVIIERQFVVGTQIPSANEFIRADCAPRGTHGDGLLTAGDTIQVRRYVAGLDPPETTGAFEALRPFSGQFNATDLYIRSLTTKRVVSIKQAEKAPAGNVVLNVDMNRLGDESAVAFTLGFDPAKLRNPVVTLASGEDTETVLTTNTMKSDNGQLAILVDSDQPLTTGQIVSITFDVVPNKTAGTTDVTFTDAITKGSTSDSEGNLLPTRFVNGVVTIPKTASPEFEISGRVLTADGRGLRNATVLLLDSSGNVRIATTSSFGFYMFNDIADAGSYTLSVESKRYHFESRTIQIAGNLTEVDIVAVR